MLECLAVRNYCTLRDFVIPLASLNLVSGANGTGKSNVYKALRLLAETARAAPSRRSRARAGCSRRCGPARACATARRCASASDSAAPSTATPST